MKVAFLGNMNNNHFAMARFLRDRGVDADVLLFDNEPEHFHPSADTYDDTYRDFCRTLTWGTPARWRQTRPTTIERDLRPYDFLIGCGLSPAYCARVGRPVDIFTPYGADLYHYTRYRLTYPNRLLGTWLAVHSQREAIPRCSVCHMDMTNPMYEERWAELRGRAERWYVGLPMVYTGCYSPELVAPLAEGTRWAREFARIRAASDLVLFSPVRHNWGGHASRPDQKATDRLLKGLALFRRRHPEIAVSLITFEYGTQVRESKALATALGLDASVHWFPKSVRKDLMAGVLQADIVCGEFEHSWLSGGVVFEALAMARPLLGYRNDELYRDRYACLYPMMNARTPESICARLEEYIADPAGHAAMGKQGLRWYHDHVVNPVIERYVDFIRVRGAGRTVAL